MERVHTHSFKVLDTATTFWSFGWTMENKLERKQRAGHYDYPRAPLEKHTMHSCLISTAPAKLTHSNQIKEACHHNYRRSGLNNTTWQMYDPLTQRVRQYVRAKASPHHDSR
jgi:hypothetical protein